MAQKGKTNNPFGRPRGSLNRTTSEIKGMINQFISGNLDELQMNFDKLEPKDKLMFFRDLLKFVLPIKAENEVIIPELTEEQTKAEIQKLKKELGIS